MISLTLIAAVAIKRIIAQPILALAAVLGLAITAALAMSVSIYVDGVYYRTFVDELTQGGERSRPPSTFSFSYVGGNDSTWEHVRAIDSFLTDGLPPELALPTEFTVQHFKTGSYNLLPRAADPLDTPAAPGRFRLGFISNIDSHISFLEGSAIRPSTAEDAPLEVLVTSSAAADFDLQVEETFLLAINSTIQLPIRIAGIWYPNDPNEAYWFTNPTVLYDYLLISPEVFATRVAPLLPGSAYAGDWHVVMSGSRVDYASATGLIERINRVENITQSNFPGLRLMVSPRDALRRYVDDAQRLTVQLYAFGAPILGLLTVFLVLAAQLSIEGRRNEIALLRSRGATTAQVLRSTLAESILLGIGALLVAVPLSLIFARLMGQTRSFLDFTAAGDARVLLNRPALFSGVAVLLITATAQMLPVLAAARHSITTYKQTRSREHLAPWWQRLGLDVLLMIPAAYGGYMMTQQGSIANEGNFTQNPLANPLLFLVPALSALALTLFVLRLLPIALRLFSWVLTRTRSVAILVTARRLARVPASYVMPMILLILTLSLSAFIAALADSLQDHLYDAEFYELGADAKFLDFGVEVAGAPNLSERFSFLPITQYVQGPFAYAAGRVGQYDARIVVGGRTHTGRFLAIDRYEFTQVAFWRADFASVDLGTLMNALAVNPSAVLAPLDFLQANALAIGDQIVVTVESRSSGVRLDMPLQIAGQFELFPTWYPADGPLFVGNLDYLFERTGGDFPYHIWFDAAPEFRRSQMGAPEWQPIALHSPWYQINQEEQSPERQGVLGLLSVGFLGAAVLTVIGFLLHVLFSFRQRFIEIGMLRSIGLSMRQLTALLAAELAFLILIGGLIGTGLGILASLFFVPYSQAGNSIPPFLVEIAWPAMIRIYGLFTGLFVAALAALALLLRRMRIAQAVKLGETL